MVVIRGSVQRREMADILSVSFMWSALHSTSDSSSNPGASVS